MKILSVSVRKRAKAAFVVATNQIFDESLLRKTDIKLERTGKKWGVAE